MGKKALLCASFGTSVSSAREKTLDIIERELAARFPDRMFYRGWTSGTIVAKVRAGGLDRETLQEAFDRMTADGVDDVLVAVTCLMHGHEMRKTEEALSAWLAQDSSRTARLATPLLETPEDCRIMARMVAQELGALSEDSALLLMGHGSPKGPNEVYQIIEDALQQDNPLMFVATVEGEPTFEDAVARIEGKGAKSIYLAPLMMVAGEHALADMAGEDEDSWLNVLQSRGLTAKAIMKGLGEYASVQGLVCDHAENAQVFSVK